MTRKCSWEKKKNEEKTIKTEKEIARQKRKRKPRTIEWIGKKSPNINDIKWKIMFASITERYVQLHCVCVYVIIDGCVLCWEIQVWNWFCLPGPFAFFYIPQAVNSIPYSHFHLFVAICFVKFNKNINNKKNITFLVYHVYHRWLWDFWFGFEWHSLSIFHRLHHMNYNRIFFSLRTPTSHFQVNNVSPQQH